MGDDCIVPVCVVIDGTMRAPGHRSHALAQFSDAEVLTVAVVAAKYCQHHQERALQVLLVGRSLPGRLSTARCNRRLHALAGWLGLLPATLGELFAQGAAFLRDHMPVPVCRRARARRPRQLGGTAFYGYCAAKKEQSCGRRLHRSCTTGGVPAASGDPRGGWLVPGGRHDPTPIHELTYGPPTGAATILAETGGRLVPHHNATMRPNDWADKLALRAYRCACSTRYRQLETMGLQRRHARTNPGLERKLHAALLAATVTNAR